MWEYLFLVSVSFKTFPMQVWEEKSVSEWNYNEATKNFSLTLKKQHFDVILLFDGSNSNYYLSP